MLRGHGHKMYSAFLFEPQLNSLYIGCQNIVVNKTSLVFQMRNILSGTIEMLYLICQHF